jgi:hypothetical protein
MSAASKACQRVKHGYLVLREATCAPVIRFAGLHLRGIRALLRAYHLQTPTLTSLLAPSPPERDPPHTALLATSPRTKRPFTYDTYDELMESAHHVALQLVRRQQQHVQPTLTEP